MMTDEILDQGGMERSAASQLSSANENYLYLAASWGSFIAVVYMIYEAWVILLSSGGFAALVGIDSLFGGGGLGAMTWFLGLVSLALEVASFFPAVYLYRFSTRMQKAISLSDDPVMTEAFKYLKKTLKSLGNLIIIHIIYVILSWFLGGAWFLSKMG